MSSAATASALAARAAVLCGPNDTRVRTLLTGLPDARMAVHLTKVLSRALLTEMQGSCSALRSWLVNEHGSTARSMIEGQEAVAKSFESTAESVRQEVSAVKPLDAAAQAATAVNQAVLGQPGLTPIEAAIQKHAAPAILEAKRVTVKNKALELSDELPWSWTCVHQLVL